MDLRLRQSTARRAKAGPCGRLPVGRTVRAQGGGAFCAEPLVASWRGEFLRVAVFQRLHEKWLANRVGAQPYSSSRHLLFDIPTRSAPFTLHLTLGGLFPSARHHFCSGVASHTRTV